MSKAQQALDKMAENARELGLDYEPVSENFMDALKFDVAMREALAEQPAQQEPVAWKLVPTKPTEEMLKAMDECSKEGYDERLYAGHAASVYMAAVDAAPTPPAQRKPLTDEEIKLVMDGRGEEGDDDYVKPAFDPFGISEDDLMNFARAIEAKLKEKNNG